MRETQSNDSQKQRPEPAPLPGGYSSRVSALTLGTRPPGCGQTHRRPSGAGQGAPAWESLSPGAGLSGRNRPIRTAEVRGRPSGCHGGKRLAGAPLPAPCPGERLHHPHGCQPGRLLPENTTRHLPGLPTCSNTPFYATVGLLTLSHTAP